MSQTKTLWEEKGLLVIKSGQLAQMGTSLSKAEHTYIVTLPKTMSAFGLYN